MCPSKRWQCSGKSTAEVDDIKSPLGRTPRCLGVAGSDLERERPPLAGAGLPGGEAARRFSDERDWGGEARRLVRRGWRTSR